MTQERIFQIMEGVTKQYNTTKDLLTDNVAEVDEEALKELAYQLSVVNVEFEKAQLILKHKISPVQYHNNRRNIR